MSRTHFITVLEMLVNNCGASLELSNREWGAVEMEGVFPKTVGAEQKAFMEAWDCITKRVQRKGFYLANETSHGSPFKFVRLYSRYPSKIPRGCTCPKALTGNRQELSVVATSSADLAKQVVKQVTPSVSVKQVTVKHSPAPKTDGRIKCMWCDVLFYDKWNDKACSTCWNADEICKRWTEPEVARVLRLVYDLKTEMKELFQDLYEIGFESVFYGNREGLSDMLIRDLYMLYPERDWEAEIEETKQFISKVKSFPVPLLERLCSIIQRQSLQERLPRENHSDNRFLKEGMVSVSA